MGDPERYRESEEVSKWEETDPIGIYNRYLVDNELAKPEELADIETKAEAIVEKAVEFAETSPNPAPEELFTDIYAEEV
jgi:pyruvate dehydrogenase E1 component alpha subunit